VNEHIDSDDTGRTRAGRAPEPVFIVGQYKCGTSWLLQALSAHPHAVGTSEIDVVRAAYRIERRTATPASPDERLARFFTSWCPKQDDGKIVWRGSEVRARLERGEEIPRQTWSGWTPRTCLQVPPEALRTFYRRAQDARLPEDAMDAFVEAAWAGAEDATVVVFKGADQIAVFDLLQAWRPDARKIAITRDGRDAAISALQFRELMREAGAPFAGRERGYWDLLRAWADRADMVRARADAGQLRVIRYEDLTRDFTGTLGPLIAWLGLDASAEVLAAIETGTSFQTMTGRPRGTEAREPKRKGAVGDWIEWLTDEEKEQAWTIAGDRLRAFGYTRDGADLRPIRRQLGLDPAEREGWPDRPRSAGSAPS
jgi:hypothetical protein